MIELNKEHEWARTKEREFYKNEIDQHQMTQEMLRGEIQVHNTEFLHFASYHIIHTIRAARIPDLHHTLHLLSVLHFASYHVSHPIRVYSKP